MEMIETFEEFAMHTHHREYVCGECGASMNDPHDWYMNECDRCLNESAE